MSKLKIQKKAKISTKISTETTNKESAVTKDTNKDKYDRIREVIGKEMKLDLLEQSRLLANVRYAIRKEIKAAKNN